MHPFVSVADMLPMPTGIRFPFQLFLLYTIQALRTFFRCWELVDVLHACLNLSCGACRCSTARSKRTRRGICLPSEDTAPATKTQTFLGALYHTSNAPVWRGQWLQARATGAGRCISCASPKLGLYAHLCPRSPSPSIKASKRWSIELTNTFSTVALEKMGGLMHIIYYPSLLSGGARRGGTSTGHALPPLLAKCHTDVVLSPCRARLASGAGCVGIADSSIMRVD